MKRLLCTLTGIALFVSTAAVFADDHGHAPAVPPQEALKRLQDGNARFVQGQAQHPNGETGRAKETAEHGQHPFATVLACSDSRCPVEIVFDQGIGDIFAIKVAGNVSGKSQLGSIEYGVAHTGTALVVVLGHTKCGAVTAACTGGGHEGSIESLVKAIEPAVKKIEKKSGKTGKDAVEDTVRANVFVQIRSLFAGSEILREAVKAKKAMVVGAVYDITTGKVEFLGEHPDTADLVSAAQKEPDLKKEKKEKKAAKPEDGQKETTQKEREKIEEPEAEKPQLVAKAASAALPAVAVNAAQPSVRASRPGSFRTFQQKKGTFMGR